MGTPLPREVLQRAKQGRARPGARVSGDRATISTIPASAGGLNLCVAARSEQHQTAVPLWVAFQSDLPAALSEQRSSLSPNAGEST